MTIQNGETTGRQAAAAAAGADAMARRHRRVATVLAGVAVGMVGMAYAAVPLYRLFCQVTGYGGTTQVATRASDTVLDRKITVRFDANVAPTLPWRFEPVQRTIDVRLGESVLVHYRATNTSDRVTRGTATFNVSPDASGVHFNKIECFCFTEQVLQPGQSVEMPVTFFVAPEFASDEDTRRLPEITLSYTFHPMEKPAAGIAPAADRADKGRS